MYNELRKLNKNLNNKWTGKTELLAGIPSEKHRRLIQPVQGKPLCMNHSWSSSPGSRMDECVFLFAKLPYLSNGISCPLPKPFSHMYRGDPSKAKQSDPTISLLDTAMAWHTSSLSLYICFFVQTGPMSRAPSALLSMKNKRCSLVISSHKVLDEISLPPSLLHKPLWRMPIPHPSESSALWHCNCLFTHLSSPLDCELLRPGIQFLLCFLTAQCPAQGQVNSGCSVSICWLNGASIS